MVNVRGENFEGYVNGFDVYRLNDVEQNFAFEYEGDTLQFIATTSFEAPLENEDGLTGCIPHTPVDLTKISDNSIGLIPFSATKSFNYLQFEDSDGGYDRVLSVSETEYLNMEVEVEKSLTEHVKNRTHEIAPMKDGGFKVVR